MSNTALKRDRREFGEPRRFATAAGIASFAVVNDFGASPQPAYLANASNVLPIPLNAELKILVRIKTLRVNCKLSLNQ